MRTFLLLLFLAVSIPISGQRMKIAVLQQNISDSHPVTSAIQDSVIEVLGAQSDVVHLVYHQDGEALEFLPQHSSDSIESTARYLMYYEIDIHEEYKPPLINSQHFKLHTGAVVRVKVIDLETNQIATAAVRTLKDAIYSFGNDLSIEQNQGVFKIDATKQFGSEGAAAGEKMKEQKPREYNALVAKLQRSLATKFRHFYISKTREVVSQVLLSELEVLVPDMLPVTEFHMDGDKAKKVEATSSVELALPKWTGLRIFSLDTLKDFVFPELYGVYTFEDQHGRNLILDAGMFSKSKQVGQAHLEGKALYASFSASGHSERLNKARDIKVGVNFGPRAITPTEVVVSRLSRIVVIDLGSTALVNLFRERYKQEQFIGDAYAAQAFGAEVLINIKGKNVQLTDVETGTLLYTYESTEGARGLIDAAMEIFDMEVQIVKVTKQTKNKIKEVQLYSPFGFDDYVTMLIYTVVQENVGGKIHERAVEIAQCSGMTRDQNVADFKIQKGEQELFEAMENGQTLRFRNKEWRFLGKTYK